MVYTSLLCTVRLMFANTKESSSYAFYWPDSTIL